MTLPHARTSRFVALVAVWAAGWAALPPVLAQAPAVAVPVDSVQAPVEATGTVLTEPMAAPAVEATAAIAPSDPVEPVPAVVSVDDLKAQAYAAIRQGEFERGNDLITEAAKLSGDPNLGQLATWTGEYEALREEFTAQRRKEYDKSVADVQKLLDAGYDTYAIDVGARAYLLAEDKKLFHEQPWVKSLINSSITLADKAQTEEKWIEALRLYGDLGSIEPSNPRWKEQLNVATRRIRLLAAYAPDVLKEQQEQELPDAKKVREILAIETKPGQLDPTSQPAEPEDDTFKTDWRQTLKGVRMDMLWDSLESAREGYYRDVTYKTLGRGGFEGLRVFLTTGGLEAAFSSLADEPKRQELIAEVDACLAGLDAASDVTEQSILRASLAKLRTANRKTLNLPEEVIVSEFADGAFGRLDPFTNMIWPGDLAEFNKGTQGEFSGVGIQIQTAEDGSIKVVSPLEDTPAYKSGIRAGDVITHIDGRSAKGITLTQAVNAITGPVGSPVTLTVRSPDGSVVDHPLHRDTIKVVSVKGIQHLTEGGWNYMLDPAQRIAYLRLTNFTKTTSEELDAAMAQVRSEGVRGVVIDLRGNPGGLLSTATEVCDRFLDSGVIVRTRPDRENGTRPTVSSANKDPQEIDMPVVVLVNQYSASASEIVSGALKDQKRALVVGERTFGKGSVQMLFPLNDRTAYLKLTTSHYYLPSGKNIHREENSEQWGVDPDITVEMTPEQQRKAQEVRQELDVLGPSAASATQPTTTPITPESILDADPQLSAALLMLRFQLAGVPVM